MPWLFAGFAISSLFRDMFNYDEPWHRFYTFIPLLMLILAFIIRFAIDYRKRWYRLLVIILCVFYFLPNSLFLYNWITYFPGYEMKRARQLSEYIDSDAQSRSLTNSDFNVLLYTIDGYWNYELAPILYFLKEKRGYPVEFTPAGNDIKRVELNKTLSQLVYLICQEYPSYVDTRRICIRKFLNWNPEYVVIQQKLFPYNTLVYTFQRIAVKSL